MANTSRVNGFRPVESFGQTNQGRLGYYSVAAADATAIYIGDMVILDGSSDTAGVASVTKATAAGALLGPVVGVSFDPTNLNTPQYRAASTAKYVYVADDPAAVFEVQASAALTPVDVGLNFNLSAGSGSTTTGLSGATLDATSVTTTTTAQFKLIGFSQRIDNASGTSVKCLVKINNHVLNGGTGTQGI